MLVLSRQRDEAVMIGDDIQVSVIDIRADKVRLGFTAPREISVHRKEVYDAIRRENRQAASLADPGAARVVPAAAATGFTPTPAETRAEFQAAVKRDGYVAGTGAK